MIEAPAGAAVIRGGDWVARTRFANQLLRQGERVLRVTRALGESPAARPGDLLVPLDPAFDAGLASPVDLAPLAARARAAGVELESLAGDGGVVAMPLSLVRIGCYGGGGAPFNHASVLGAAGFPIRFISDAEVRAGELSTIDVFVMPGGGTRAMHGQLEPLGEAGARALADWVRTGGMYIGSCAGAYDCAVTSPAFVATCPPKGSLQLINARVWNEEEAEATSELDGLQSPGIGVVRVRTTSPEHPVMLGMPASFELVHYNGPVFDLLPEPLVEGASLADGLIAFDGAAAGFTPAERFMGGEPAGATLLERASQAGKYSAVAGELGTGRVVAFGSHPEFGADLSMRSWGAPARMLVNAALWQASARPADAAAPWSYLAAPGPTSAPRGAALDAVVAAASQVTASVATLRERPISPAPAWLAPAYAMAFFGLGPEAIWTRSLDEIDALCEEAADLARDLRAALADLGASRAEREAARQIERWILDERPAAWRQDGGYQGVLALLADARGKCEDAAARWEAELGPPAGPYDYFDENPYHLVAGSYLAAIGSVVGAVQLLRALAAEVELARRLAAPEALATAGAPAE